MSGRLKQTWKDRQWFDLPLAILGFMMMLLGSTFFIIVASVGAPVVPFGGLVIAIFGDGFSPVLMGYAQDAPTDPLQGFRYACIRAGLLAVTSADRLHQDWRRSRTSSEHLHP